MSKKEIVSVFSQLADGSKCGGAFERYSDPEYIAQEMRNLLRVSLIHSADLVRNIEDNSPEAVFLEHSFGINIHEVSTDVDKSMPVRNINTHTHSFNSVSMPGSGVSREIQDNVDALAKQSGVARRIMSGDYDNFGQVLDEMFPDWKSQVAQIRLYQQGNSLLEFDG